MTARWITADVFTGLATLETGSVDLVVTSPPFLALRSYLPADHPDKSKEIGSEATPAEFIDTLLRVTAELRRVLAPHGSICVELGDTYAGSGGGGGDYDEEGLREGQPKFRQGTPRWDGRPEGQIRTTTSDPVSYPPRAREGWPLAKSRTLIPSLYQIALAYGINPLTGQPSPAGQWRIRNIVTWARPNPPVGALGDNWRPGLILDPFAGSGTTLAVATGHGHNAIGIDIDSRNADLARDRVGPFLFEMVDLPIPTP